MDKAQAAKDIITSALPHIPFDGWTMHALGTGAIEAGYQKTDVIRVFPDGAMQAVDRFFAFSDRAMEEALAAYHLDSMKIRERITLAVKLRIGIHDRHAEALRRAVSLYMLPFNLPRAMHSIYRTVDSIWHAIGDTSTDFNFYSKRATLAAVYLATVHFWLNDESPGKHATWDYLDRRIQDVMQFEKFKFKLKSMLGN